VSVCQHQTRRARSDAIRKEFIDARREKVYVYYGDRVLSSNELGFCLMKE
jgi:hypothetical protein